MKINKSILTGMTALSLFATSAAAATSAVTPVVSNAAAKKSEAKKSYTYYWLFKVVSKGHDTHYFKEIEKTEKITKEKMQKKGDPKTAFIGPLSSGKMLYSIKNTDLVFKLKGNRIVRVQKGTTVYTSKKHKATKDSGFIIKGRTFRISKAEFNKLNKEQTR